MKTWMMGPIPSALGPIWIMAHGSLGPIWRWIILNLWKHMIIYDEYWQLTHLPLDKMATISQIIFSDAFFVSWMKSLQWRKYFMHLKGIRQNKMNIFNSSFPRQNGLQFGRQHFNVFSWMEMIEFRLKFHWNLFPGVQLTISQHCFR